MATVARVTALPAAKALIERLQMEYGPVMFHQSGGCCDGSSLMCYPEGGFIIGDSEVRLGDIAGAAFYMGQAQFEYWQGTQLIIDVISGQGGMLSLDNGTGLRFLTRSRLFTEEEISALAPI
jgi:uncharacterized protein (DUF779 family)